MLGGLLNQDVQQGDGPDETWIHGGLINGGVATGAGEDHLLWDAGNIKGFGIDMGDDDDVAVFRELTPDNLTSGLKIDGGLGDDELFWQTTTGADVSRFLRWETFDLTNGSELAFDGTLTMGDSGTGTGVLYIDPTSTVLAGNRGAVALVPALNDKLAGGIWNDGTIDLTNGDGQPEDSLRIRGRYYRRERQPEARHQARQRRRPVRPPDHRRRRRLRRHRHRRAQRRRRRGSDRAERHPPGARAERRDHPGSRLQPRRSRGRRTLRILPVPRRQGPRRGRYREQLVSADGTSFASSFASFASSTATAAPTAAVTVSAASAAAAAASTPGAASRASGAAGPAHDPETVAQGWQRHYVRGEEATGSAARACQNARQAS